MPPQDTRLRLADGHMPERQSSAFTKARTGNQQREHTLEIILTSHLQAIPRIKTWLQAEVPDETSPRKKSHQLYQSVQISLKISNTE